MGLEPDQIEALLKGELERAAYGNTKTPTGGSISGLPRPTQLGPLRWHDDTAPCTSRGCTSPTFIRVKGAAKCTNHALQALNELWLQENDPEAISLCTCKAGTMSRYNIHTYDCKLVKVTSLSLVGSDAPSDELL